MPWLDKDHIREAHLDDKGHFVLHFLDGMKNVCYIDDCKEALVKKVLKRPEKAGYHCIRVIDALSCSPRPA